ncbi:MAG: GNAT family N-acetyltransferase [Flavisolibacter sp.]
MLNRDLKTELNILLREADLEEASVVSSILYHSFISFRAFYTSKAFDTTAASSESIVQRMKEGPVWVVELGHRLVGTLGAVEEEGGLYLRGMAVLPEARGRKIGRLLLELAENFARERNYKKLSLTTTIFLKEAISLYSSFGFTWTNATRDLFGTELLCMEKILKPQTLSSNNLS